MDPLDIPLDLEKVSNLPVAKRSVPLDHDLANGLNANGTIMAHPR